MFQSQEKLSILKELEQRKAEVERLELQNKMMDQALVRMSAELSQKETFIGMLITQIRERDEKLILMLDPQKYNQFKLHTRPRVGAVELTEKEKKDLEAKKAQVQKDVQELISLGVLSPTAAVS